MEITKIVLTSSNSYKWEHLKLYIIQSWKGNINMQTLWSLGRAQFLVLKCTQLDPSTKLSHTIIMSSLQLSRLWCRISCKQVFKLSLLRNIQARKENSEIFSFLLSILFNSICQWFEMLLLNSVTKQEKNCQYDS